MAKRKYTSILVSSLWIGLILLLLVSMGFANARHSVAKCVDLKVNIDDKDGMYFIDKPQINEFVYAQMGDPRGMAINDLDLAGLENAIKSLDAVKNAEVYKDLKGNLTIDIEQRSPIARIFDREGNSFYMDEHGKKMSLSVRYTARVIAVNGHLLSPADEQAYEEQWAELYSLVMKIKDDELFSAQFEQIYVRSNGDLELSPRVGRHSILLGKAENMDKKLKKLKLFYSDGIANVDWNKYKQIDLRFEDQVVCTKR